MTYKQIICTLAFLLLSSNIYAATGDITTLVGGGTADNVPAISTGLDEPTSVYKDAAGNLFICEARNHRIRKVSTSGIITTVAGNGTEGFSGDGGLATNAQLDTPISVYGDAAGNLYISDNHNHRIRKVNTSGIITTIAGTGTGAFSGDGGLAILAEIEAPNDIQIDAAGNLYFADFGNHRIRKIDTSGIITTVAGSGSSSAGAYTGDGGLATTAQLHFPTGVTLDAAGNMYIGDYSNHVVRKVNISGIISTFAGNNTPGFSGDSGQATSAQLNFPRGVFINGTGNLFIVDTNNLRIRKVNTSGVITTVAGAGPGGVYSGDGGQATNARFASIYDVFVDSADTLFITDHGSQRVRKVDPTGIITTAAGGGAGDGGPASLANLNGPNGLHVDATGNVYFTDLNYMRIRKIDTSGTITRVAGSGSEGFSGDGGLATLADIETAYGVAVDNVGNIYFSDYTNQRVRKVDTSGIITTFAGNGTGGFAGDGGLATNGNLSIPIGLALDILGNLYIADHSNNRIRKVDTSGIITTVAGNGIATHSGDGGQAINASIKNPQGVFVHSSGDIYIADTGNHRVRKIDTSGVITTVAGNGVNTYSGDGGQATIASLYNPKGVVVDAVGNIYIADTTNNRVRKVDLAGIITTIAGNGVNAYAGDGGPATNASMYNPTDVAFDSAGNLYISDQTNDRIRKVTLEINPLVSIPDTIAPYSSTVNVPIRIQGATGTNIVAAEIKVAFDNTIATLGSPNKTTITSTLVALGWSVEENVLLGSGNIDTLTIAMSTAADTINSDGDLITLIFDTANIRQPASTALELTQVLFNDGIPSPIKQNGSLTLIGTNGTITALPDSITPGNIVNITVTDTDHDLDVGNPDQVSATAISKLYNDTQTVTLTETGANTGIFTGSVNTAFALAAGPSEDGFITTIAGDSICVSYVDSLTASGTTLTRQDIVEVIGGVDGIVVASYVVQALDARNGVRDTVRVQVTDADLDLDVGSAEQVSATITNAISGESESVTLTETGINTGIFQIRVPSIVGASGTNNDGILSLASWDTLNVSYTDSLTAQGGISPVNDITRVVNAFGDVQSNDQIQAFDAARLLAISVGLVSSNTQTTLVGDVDGGGAIQAFDASLVLQYVVRLIDRFPVQTDFTADPKNHPFEKPALGSVIVLGDISQQTDGTYLIPVQLSEREGVLSGTLTLGMDTGIDIVDIMLANGYTNFMSAHNTTDEGVKVAFAGSQSKLNGSGDVLLLKVRNIENTPIRLSLDHVVLNGQTLTPIVNIEAIEAMQTETPTLITQLYQNVPNPFNPQTTIRYDLAEAGHIRIVIYSITGQRIRTLISEQQTTGSYQIVWDGKSALGQSVSSGVYLMRMTTDSFSKMQKMLLLR